MKPALNVLMSITLLLGLAGCKSMPELWGSGEAEPVAEAKPEEPKPVKAEKPQPTLKDLIRSDLKRNRLSKPSGNNAIEKIERLRKQSPKDPDIKRFELAVIDRYLLLAEKRITRSTEPSRKDLEKALSYINTARSMQTPSAKLDKKEEEIIELLDIVIQKEQLEKARAAEAAKPKPVEPPKVEEQVEEVVSVKPNPQINNPNFLALQQDQIASRSQDINLQLDSISKRIVNERATVVIHAQSMSDFRYLKSSLRTSLYWVDSNFNLSAEPHIDDTVSPGIEITTGQ
ncbi:MAG: hypothetical protein MI867_24800 [Pseudomonadales bacterium]|nr:hypothetical protein [Pseudomonadales bacterium]